MKLRNIYILISALAISAAISCKHSPLTTVNPDELTPTGNNSGNNNPGNNNEIPCDSDSVYFNNTILPLFISNCAMSGCHDALTAEDGIILDSYANIMNSEEIQPFDASEGDIMESILTNNPNKIMPPPPNQALTQQQINQIIQWINQGAPDNHCFECDTLNITYSGKVRTILDGKCLGCHNYSLISGGVNLSDYQGVQAVALNGQLFGAINHSPGYTAMPQGGNQLQECEIDAVRIWIEDGAINN